MGTSLNWITDSVASLVPAVSPGRPAVALDDRAPLTYGELREAELRYATALRQAGVRRGDRIGILMCNCVEYIVCYLAIARLGAISMRPNWRLTGPELQFQLTDAGVKVLLLDEDFVDTVGSIRAEVPVQTYVVRAGRNPLPRWAIALSDFAATDTGGGFPELGMDDPCTLMYTSGTTGRPKGAVLTHGNVLWIAAMQAMKFKFDDTSIALTAGPLFHAGGLEVLFLPALFSHGTAVTLSSGGFSLDRFLQVARRQSVTAMLAYSFVVYDLVRLANLDTAVPKTLRLILTGGDTIMPWVYDELEKRLPGVELVQSYSLTEAGTVGTMLDHRFARGRERSVGRPNPLTEVKLLDAEGQPVPSGKVGEVCLRSPGVSPGYWNRPDATADTFTDGWCRTGDLGSVDAKGFLTLAGRAKDMIRSGGENIYAAEIEEVLTGHPDVEYAAVVGVPDAKYVEVGCAILQAHPGRDIDVDAIRAYCTDRLAKYKIPKYLVVVDQLPRNASGKVQKFLLREQYASLGEAR
jgi:fatty-acyl-CoA synthase